MQHEIWKDIPNYVGKYQCSNLGRIKSLYRKIVVVTPKYEYVKTVRERILKTTADKDGYHQVSLSGDTHKVNRLVLISFIGDSDLLSCHRDGNALNNNLNNLYWGTHKDNSRDAREHRTIYRKKCKRGHLIADPNITYRKKSRYCKACLKTSNLTQRRKSRKGTITSQEQMQVISDKYYQKIMKD